MIKAIYFIKRKPGMTLEAFREYWLKDHAALVLKVPGLVKYVQSHTIDSGRHTSPASPVGCARRLRR